MSLKQVYALILVKYKLIEVEFSISNARKPTCLSYTVKPIEIIFNFELYCINDIR